VTASYSQRKTHARHGAQSINAVVDTAVAELKAAQAAEWKANKAAAEKAEQERVRLTRADIDGKTFVKTRTGWHRIARLNAKTVSVETGYSWVNRIPFDDILDAR
jgi:hypothetical protein